MGLCAYEYGREHYAACIGHTEDIRVDPGPTTWFLTAIILVAVTLLIADAVKGITRKVKPSHVRFHRTLVELRPNRHLRRDRPVPARDDRR